MNHKHILLTLVVGMLVGLTSCSIDEDLTTPNTLTPRVEYFKPKAAKANKSQLNKLVAQVRRATAKYHNHQAALDDGFFNTEDCVELPGVGGMGVHFVKFDRVDGVHNPLEPEVLVYQLKNNGTYKLGAVEYLHVGGIPPKFGGEIEFLPFSQPFADFERHVWLWNPNPAGLFEDWNPRVTCP
ncbi:hypothetical protein GGR28_000634 [Lewinella aquimaris]|uniref:Uncharacterized protein n=1 Tax=Neolewinella aquimaris TaxID=1835722 RepID=A0A840E251_9BACT|nr:acid shock protein [Neolewinella aquimaris]MBB4078033.1 hypothetical protein [Neolewinella aquimaris]